MRKICVLILLFLLVFSTSAEAGDGDTGAPLPLFIKESVITKTDQETYHLLRHIRGDSASDGKFLLVDKNLNIIAETPYVYNLYTYCYSLSACYFFNFTSGPFPRNAWQLASPLATSSESLLDIYDTFYALTKSQPGKIEQDGPIDFLNDPTQTAFSASPRGKPFTRGATFSNLTPAPRWFTYAVPLAFALIGIALYAFFFWPFKKLKNLARTKRDSSTGKVKTAYTVLMLFAYMFTITSGIILALLAFYNAPILYAWAFVLFLGFFGFGTQEAPTPKTDV